MGRVFNGAIYRVYISVIRQVSQRPFIPFANAKNKHTVCALLVRGGIEIMNWLKSILEQSDDLVDMPKIASFSPVGIIALLWYRTGRNGRILLHCRDD